MASVHLPIGDLSRGQLLSERFEIVRELGRGGYSVVYLAHDHRVGTDVAVKVLVPSPVSARQARERMRREVQAIRGLRHPNLVGVHDFQEDGSLAYVVMDFVDGQDLATLIETRGPLPATEVAAMARDLASALATAHRAGILHRDIKPANVLIDRRGKPWLTDFGSARLDSQATVTATGGLVGTVAYLAPEVWLGERPDARSDVYALGLTLYQALTGELPERASSHLPPAPDDSGFRPSVRRPDVPQWLDQLVAAATAANPRYRIATADHLLLAATQERATTPLAVEAPRSAAGPVRLPTSFWVLIAGVVATGMMAGVSASDHFYWATPIVALLLIRAGRRERDLASDNPQSPPPARWKLGPVSEAQLASLPPGPTRALADDILALAQGLVSHAATPQLTRRWREQLEPLVDSAVATAADLAELDDTLSRLERDTPQRRDPPADWWDTLAALERTRDGLSTALLDVVGTLARAKGSSIDEFAGARARLDHELTEIKAEVSRRVGATQEVDRALSPR